MFYYSLHATSAKVEIKMWKIASFFLLIFLCLKIVIWAKFNIDKRPNFGRNVHVWNKLFLEFTKLDPMYKNASDCLRDYSQNLTGVPELVVYTKIPKTGSTTIMELMRNLTLLFKRYHFHYTPTFNYVKDRDSNFTFDQFMRYYWKPPCPKLLGGHEPFVNFQEYGKENPVYITLIREPFRRAESNFYHSKKFGQNIVKESDTFIECLNQSDCLFLTWCTQFAFICGKTEECYHACKLTEGKEMDEMLQKTMRNVEQFYSTVLILERMEDSLQLLEKKVPQYFAGISNIYIRDVKKFENKDYESLNVTSALRAQYCQKQPLECKLYDLLNERMNKLLHDAGIRKSS